MGKLGRVFWSCFGFLLLFVAPRFAPVNDAEAATVGNTVGNCTFGARTEIKQTVLPNAILQDIQGGRHRASICHAVFFEGGYTNIIVGTPVRGGAGPIQDKFSMAVSGQTDNDTDTVRIEQEVELEFNIFPTPAGAAVGQGWATLDHKLVTNINGVQDDDDLLLMILANGLSGGPGAVRGNATGTAVVGLDGFAVTVCDTVTTDVMVGVCTAFSGTAEVASRLHHWVTLTPAPPGTVSFTSTGTALDMDCSLQ